MTGYYPVNLPHGVVRKGMIFVPLSLTDAKAGTNERALFLVDEHGLTTELARCQPTIEYQDSALVYAAQKLDAYRNQFIRDICKDTGEPVRSKDINTLVEQLLTLLQVLLLC